MDNRIVRYCAYGAMLYVTALVLMYLLVNVLGLKEAVAYALVQALTWVTSLFVARTWIFDAAHQALSGIAIKFLASTLIFRLMNWGIYTACFYLLSTPRELGIILAMTAVLPVKYWTEKELVFNSAAR